MFREGLNKQKIYVNTHRWIEDLLSIYGSLISEQIKFIVSQTSVCNSSNWWHQKRSKITIHKTSWVFFGFFHWRICIVSLQWSQYQVDYDIRKYVFRQPFAFNFGWNLILWMKWDFFTNPLFSSTNSHREVLANNFNIRRKKLPGFIIIND